MKHPIVVNSKGCTKKYKPFGPVVSEIYNATWDTKFLELPKSKSKSK